MGVAYWVWWICMVVGYSCAIGMCVLWSVVVMERPRWAMGLVLKWGRRGVDRAENSNIQNYALMRAENRSNKDGEAN